MEKKFLWTSNDHHETQVQARRMAQVSAILLAFVLLFIGRIFPIAGFSPSYYSTALKSTESSDLGTPTGFDVSTSNTSSNNEYSFFDEVSIYVRAGSGGQGSSTYKKAKKSQNGIPDGGSGGLGGNVVFHVDPSLNTLASFTGGGVNDNKASAKRAPQQQQRLMSFRAETGHPGGRMYDNGRQGEDCIVRVPPGTVVSIEEEPTAFEDEETGETKHEISSEDKSEEDGDESAEIQYELREVGTLTVDHPTLVVARGGTGGEGTATLKGKKKGAKRRGPTGGERFRLRLTLKIVADVALCGVPNAGKSTFLAAVTRAEPKIANVSVLCRLSWA